MRNIRNHKFPCRFCTKNVHDKDKAVQCDLCELWIHIKCNNLNYLDYRYLQNCDEFWYCIECCSTISPFNSLSSNKKFPLKRVKKYKLKFKSKPWITLGLQKSIFMKNKLLTNFINKKDPILKEECPLTTRNIEIYSPPLWRKVNRLIKTDILKKIGKILRTHGKELNPSFL